MLCRLSLRAVAQNGRVTLRAVPAATQPALTSASFHTNTHDTEETKRLIERWDACNEKYYGKFRDMENFPHPVMQEKHEAARLGFIPRSWFDALYSKTGVSGPYVALGGLSVYVLSKEIFVKDHGMFEALAFWGMIIFITKKWGATISGALTKHTDALNEKNFHAPIKRTRTAFNNAVGVIDTEIDQEARHKYVYDVQKENLDLQLEARYRERVAQVYDAVKRRLDYQVELVNTKKRFEQQHMVNWIVDSVVKGITPKQEKDAITSCIANLKSLAKAQPAV